MKSITVKHKDIYVKLNLKDLVEQGMSIYEFLSFLDIDDIEEYILTKYYKRKPRNSIKGMIRLSIAYTFYKQKGRGYEWLINNLSESFLLSLH